MNVDCKCKKCQGACENKPGWFLPGEAEKAAALIGVSLPQFFKQKLMVDWWEDWPVGKNGSTREVFVISPAIVGQAGEEAPGDPRGRCVFLKNGLCEIHAAKPHECRMHIHSEGMEEIQARKKRIVKAWAPRAQQKQIIELLGRRPQASQYFGGLFGGLFGMLGL